MRLQVASCHRLLLLLITLITEGLTIDHDFGRTLSGSNSLMNTMMEKYSYPKNEVTAGVGYGHHLHPLYYRGPKEMMYPCAVECGEWEAMKLDDSANDASSNVDVVTVHPDVSTIDITTTKSRPYKDVSFLRPKKYKSSLFSATTTTPSTQKKTRNNDLAHQDSKGADVQIIPQKTENKYLGGSDNDKEMPNDGSLYAKYYDALVSGYEGELNSDNTENKENEQFDPMEDSFRYNPPSFIDAESDDIESPVSPTNTKSHPKRERIEEKYVKHNVREERLEDVRTNSFGPLEGDEDYLTDYSPSGKQSGSYDPSKYIDDYAAPIKPNRHPNKNYQAGSSGGGKPFRPSPPQGQNFQEGERRPPVYNGHLRNPNEKLRPFYDPRNQVLHQDSNGYSNYQAEDYNAEGESDYDESPPKSAYFNPPNYNIKQGRNHGKQYPYGRAQDPRIIRRPAIYGRNRNLGKYSQTGINNPHRNPFSQSGYSGYPSKYGAYPKNLYSENGAGHPNLYPYAPRHGYLPQSQDIPVRSGGLRVVPPPRIRGNLPRHEKLPYYTKGVRSPPYVRGQRISYRRTIPQRDGFTKIIKNYRSFVDHTPKRYVGSGEPYVTR